MSIATDALTVMRDGFEGPKREDESQTAFAIRMVQLETVQAAVRMVLRAELLAESSSEFPNPRCSKVLCEQGKPYPRTCPVHGLFTHCP